VLYNGAVYFYDYVASEALLSFLSRVVWRNKVAVVTSKFRLRFLFLIN